MKRTREPRSRSELVDRDRVAAVLLRSSGWVDIEPGSLRRSWWSLHGSAAFARHDPAGTYREGWIFTTAAGDAMVVRDAELVGVRAPVEAVTPLQLRLEGVA